MLKLSKAFSTSNKRSTSDKAMTIVILVKLALLPATSMYIFWSLSAFECCFFGCWRWFRNACHRSLEVMRSTTPAWAWRDDCISEWWIQPGGRKCGLWISCLASHLRMAAMLGEAQSNNYLCTTPAEQRKRRNHNVIMKCISVSSHTKQRKKSTKECRYIQRFPYISLIETCNSCGVQD